MKHTCPERIRAWVARQFAEHRVDAVTDDLIDVATGNRAGNAFEVAALDRIFPQWQTTARSKQNISRRA